MSAPVRRRSFLRTVLLAAVLCAGVSGVAAKGSAPPPSLAGTDTPMQIFGVWHCGNHYCDWNENIDIARDGAFDRANRWLLQRDPTDAASPPAVNLVVLSFVNPWKMLKGSDSGRAGMIPLGMEPAVTYFKSEGIRVMLSIGGITYTDDWDAALAENPEQLAINAATIAGALGVGIEIDYENSRAPNIPGLERFINKYREIRPYDPSGADPAARLTIDVAAGDRWLIELNRYATANWLRADNPVLDYANAMVAGTSSGTPTDWQEHIDGKPQYAPPVLPLAPARFTAGLYLKGNNANCTNFASSEQKAHATYVRQVLPNPVFPLASVSNVNGYTPGLLGYMFWAAGTPTARKGYTPTTNCAGGMGLAADAFSIPVPMPPLRQK